MKKDRAEFLGFDDEPIPVVRRNRSFFSAAHPAGRTQILPAGFVYPGTGLRGLSPEAPSEGCGEKDAEGNDADHP
jgi:hypothetical protein